MSVQKIVPNANTSHAPAISVIGYGGNPKVYLAWKNALDASIWWSVYDADGDNWTVPVQVYFATSNGLTPVLTSGGPALGACQGSDGNANLTLAWNDEGGSTVWYSLYNGFNWSQPVVVSRDDQSAGEPSLATYVVSGYSVITWKSELDNTIWFAQQNDDGTWAQAQIPEAKTSSRPTIYLVDAGGGGIAWKGESDNTIWFAPMIAGENQLSFGPQERIPVHKARTSTGPGMGAGDVGPADDGVYLVWKGESDNAIWWSLNFGPQERIPVVATSSKPAIAGDTKWDSQVYLAWKGEADGLIWYSTSYDGVTWSI
jgi:hypothetical protein